MLSSKPLLRLSERQLEEATDRGAISLCASWWPNGCSQWEAELEIARDEARIVLLAALDPEAL